MRGSVTKDPTAPPRGSQRSENAMCQDGSPEAKWSQLKCQPALPFPAAPFSLSPHLLSGGDGDASGMRIKQMDICAEQHLARNVRVG